MADYEDGPPHPGHHSYHHHDPSSSTYASHPVELEEYPMSVQRTLTHGSSHQSHAPNTHVSSQSWVPVPPSPAFLDMHRQPPRDVMPGHIQTPFYGPRPLPDPHHHQQPRRPIHYADPIEDDEEEEEGYGYQDVDPHSGHPVQYGHHLNENVQEFGGHALSPPQNLLAPQSPQFSDLSRPTPRPKKSFVGGFVKGIKRAFGGGGGTRSRNGKLVRKGTFGTDRSGGTNTTITQMTRGNTLPRYLSNPSIGPSNPQFAHRLSMAVANGALPPNSTPRAFQPLRDVPIPGRYPSVMVTPPSEGAIDEEDDMYYNEPPTNDRPEYNQPEYNQPEYPVEMEESQSPPIHPNPMERTTVMTYGTTTEPPPPQSRVQSQIPSPARVPVPAPPPDIVSTPAPATVSPLSRQNTTRGTRVSYGSTPVPNRANVSAQTEIPPLPQSVAYLTPPASPRAVNIAINRRPTPLPMRSHRFGVTSPRSNSRYTATTAASYYDPSFASDLTPIEKFFKGLYNLPWIGQRVTVDYRPKDSKTTRTRTRGLAGGWYRNLISRSQGSNRDIDVTNSELDSPTAGTGTERMVGGSIAHTLSLLASPTSRRSRGSSNNHHHHHKRSWKQKHRRRRRRTADTALTDVHTQRSMSPIVPTMYPYTYPSFPYAYPYAPYPNPQVYPQRTPRGPRARHRHREKEQQYAQPQPQYPYGYAGYGQGYGYQPMVAPPVLPQGHAAPNQIYFITPSPPISHTDGERGYAQAQAQAQAEAQKRGQPMAMPLPQYPGVPMQMPMQVPPMVMQFVPGYPGAYGQVGQVGGMASPPITPKRTSGRSQQQQEA